MAHNGKHALVTGSSRGIGRGIALKLAEQGVKVAIHYRSNETAAKDTLAKVRQRGSDGFSVQAMLLHPRTERGQRGGLPFHAALAAKGFQPVHLAAQLAQPQHVLEVNPEMPAALREGGHIGRRNDDGRHVVKWVNSE